MKALVLTLSFLFSLNLLAHCPMNFSEVDLCADIEWIDGPNLDKTSHFQLIFWKNGDHNHEPISPRFDLDIFSWMIMHHGHSHGGPKMTFQEISTGVFEVKDARFFMGGMQGHWEVRVNLLDGEDVVSQGISKVDLSGNGHGHGHHH